jgi:hypothetical protein
MKTLKETAQRMMATILEVVEGEPESSEVVGRVEDDELVIDAPMIGETPHKFIELCW